jgi:hypothetical protein
MNASIVAAWRDEDRVAYVATLWQGSGADEIYKTVTGLCTKSRLPVIYDGRPSGNAVIAERLGKARIKLEPQVWGQVSTAAQLFKSEFEAGNIRHWGDPPLDTAVACATRRGSRDSERWAFGRPSDADNITAREAASLALRAYDESRARGPRLGIVTA